jgi:ribosome maturation factor RimP
MSDIPVLPPSSDRLTEEISLLLASLGLTLYDLVLPKKNGGVFRVFVDGPEGVTLDQIESVSRKISVLLDVMDPFPGRYHLEISSPGLDRILKIPAELSRNPGKWVLVKLHNAVLDEKVWRGRIGAVGEAGFEILVDSGKTKEKIHIDFMNVKSVQAEFWKPVLP